MKGTVWQRCTTCSRKVNGTAATKRHRESDCEGTNATWAFKTDVGTGEDGSRRQVVRAGFATQGDADRALRELLGKHDRGRHVEDVGQSLGEFLLEEWAPAMKPKVAASTYDSRMIHVRNHVVPRIGGLPLMKVTAGDLERMYAELLESGGSRSQGLAASSVRSTHRVLHKAYVDAVRWRRTDHNPVAVAEAPQLTKVDAEARAARKAWTGDELGRSLDELEGHRFYLVFALAAYTGARRSELLAITWDDVDLQEQRLTIDKAYVLDDDGKSYYVRHAGKSTASARTISLDGTTVALLKAHRAAQAAWQLQAGSAWQGDGTVLTDELGAMLSPPAVSQAWKRAVDGLEVESIRLHDLRHTHATILLQAGVPVRTVSQRLGHRSAIVTMSIYSHVLPGDDEAAAAQFEGLVQRKDAL